MELRVRLNNLSFRYDVFQILNLFYGFIDINFVQDNFDLSIEILENKILIEEGALKKIYSVINSEKIKEQVKKSLFTYLTEKSGMELPWGTLVGIRPTKIVLSLLNCGMDKEKVVKYFKEHYLASREKAELCIEVAEAESKMVNRDCKNISVYIGMPFCPTRCLYCSFASNPIKGSCRNLVEPYIDALKLEMQRIQEFIDSKGLNIECVYFGGGTPTAVNDIQFADIMDNIYRLFIEKRDVKEFTVECGRPDSITEGKLKTMKRLKVHRISINPQSMNDETLTLIGRNHSVHDVIEKFKLARELGFENINMDIIVGLPGEGINNIEKTYDEIIKLSPDSLTVHGMSVKRGSRLHENLINDKKFGKVEQSELNKMYEKTVELAKVLRMKPYYMYRQKNMVGSMENIGYSRPNKEGLYNVQMIEERQTIIACGADAVSKIVFLNENRIERFANVKDVKEYVSRIDEMINRKISLLETLYKGR